MHQRFRASLPAYTLTLADDFASTLQPHYQLVDQVLKLGAQMFRWPVSASSVNAIIMEDAVANAGFEARTIAPLKKLTMTASAL